MIREECGRWLLYITDIFLPIVDSETGDWRHLPFPGSAMDQPYMTMQILKLIQLNFRKHLAEKDKKRNRPDISTFIYRQELIVVPATAVILLRPFIPYIRSYNYLDILIYNGFCELSAISQRKQRRHFGIIQFKNRQALLFERRSIFYSC